MQNINVSTPIRQPSVKDYHSIYQRRTSPRCGTRRADRPLLTGSGVVRNGLRPASIRWGYLGYRLRRDSEQGAANAASAQPEPSRHALGDY